MQLLTSHESRKHASLFNRPRAKILETHIHYALSSVLSNCLLSQIFLILRAVAVSNPSLDKNTVKPVYKIRDCSFEIRGGGGGLDSSRLVVCEILWPPLIPVCFS